MRRRLPLDRALARRLADRRRAAGLTQNDLALRLDVSESVICRWETLRAPIPPQALALVERALTSAEGAVTTTAGCSTPQPDEGARGERRSAPAAPRCWEAAQ
jgi:transcriptional regulator with XRE-family HTH domain